MKRIIALIGAVFLLFLYGLALFFSLSNKPGSENWLMAAIFATIAIPILMYAWNLAARFFKKDHKENP